MKLMVLAVIAVMTTNTIEKQQGLSALEGAIVQVENKIKSFGGILKIKMAPKIVTDVEEADLARQLEAAEDQLREVAGDDDDEEEEEEMMEGDLPEVPRPSNDDDLE